MTNIHVCYTKNGELLGDIVKSPVVILSFGDYEPIKCLIVNGTYIAGCIDFMDSESIEMKAIVIAEALLCDIQQIDCVEEYHDESIIGYNNRDNHTIWSEIQEHLIKKNVLNGPPDSIKKRYKSVLYINHYF